MQGLVMGSSNFHTPIDTSTTSFRGGYLSLTLIFICLSTMIETDPSLSNVVDDAGVQLLHRVKKTFAYAIIDIPFSVLCQLVFSVCAFALAEDQISLSEALTFLVYAILTAIYMKFLFRLIASTTSSSIVYYALAAILSVFTLLYAGFALPSPGLDLVRRTVLWLDVS